MNHFPTRLHFLTAGLALVIALNFAAFAPVPATEQRVAGIRIVAPLCADTDKGIVPAVAGTVSGRKYARKYSDTCRDTARVREYFCANNKVSSRIIHCGKGEECIDSENGGQCQQLSPEGDDIFFKPDRVAPAI